MQNFEYGKFFQLYTCARVVNICIYHVAQPNPLKLSHSTLFFPPFPLFPTPAKINQNNTNLLIHTTHYHIIQILPNLPHVPIIPHNTPNNLSHGFNHLTDLYYHNHHKSHSQLKLEPSSFTINQFSISNIISSYILSHSTTTILPIRI